MHIALVILFIFFSFIFQLMLMKLFRTGISDKKINLLKTSLYLDTFLVFLALFVIFFVDLLQIKYLSIYLLVLGGLIFYNVFAIVLELSKTRKKTIGYILINICSIILIIFSKQIGSLVISFIILFCIVAWYFFMIHRRPFHSKRVKIFVLFYSSVEIIRYSLANIIVYLINSNDVTKNLWTFCFYFLLRMFSLFIMLEIQSYTKIDRNLIKLFDRQTAPELLDIILKEAPHAIVITDIDRKIVYANSMSLVNTKYKMDDVIGKNPKVFASGKTERTVYDSLTRDLDEKNRWTGEFVNKKRDGNIFIESAKIVTLFDSKNEPAYYLAMKTDITKEKSYLEQLEFNSNHDLLTGLLQRHKFINYFDEYLESTEDIKAYFMLFDLDDFKEINDDYGHLSGDVALISFSNILLEIMKKYGFICRFGGDEFAALIFDLDEDEVLFLLEKIKDRLSNEPIKQFSRKIRTSIGISKIDKKENFNYWYEATDKLLYQAKKEKNKTVSNF